MPKSISLSADDIAQALKQMPLWRHEGDALMAALKFSSFMQAMEFVNACAVHAERLDHHPTWSNTYNKVDITLTTHDAGNKVTAKDIELARAMAADYDKLK